MRRVDFISARDLLDGTEVGGDGLINSVSNQTQDAVCCAAPSSRAGNHRELRKECDTESAADSPGESHDLQGESVKDFRLLCG